MREGRAVFLFALGSLNAEHIVAHLHEGEQIYLGGDHGLLCLREVELGVGEGLQGFAALLLGDVASTLQVVQSEDVLKLLVSVDDRAGSVLFSNLDLVDEELLNIVGLFVSQKGGQVLEEFKNLVLAEILVSVSQHLVVDVLQS